MFSNLLISTLLDEESSSTCSESQYEQSVTKTIYLELQCCSQAGHCGYKNVIHQFINDNEYCITYQTTTSCLDDCNTFWYYLSNENTTKGCTTDVTCSNVIDSSLQQLKYLNQTTKQCQYGCNTERFLEADLQASSVTKICVKDGQHCKDITIKTKSETYPKYLNKTSNYCEDRCDAENYQLEDYDCVWKIVDDDTEISEKTAIIIVVVVIIIIVLGVAIGVGICIYKNKQKSQIQMQNNIQQYSQYTPQNNIAVQ